MWAIMSFAPFLARLYWKPLLLFLEQTGGLGGQDIYLMTKRLMIPAKLVGSLAWALRWTVTIGTPHYTLDARGEEAYLVSSKTRLAVAKIS